MTDRSPASPDAAAPATDSIDLVVRQWEAKLPGLDFSSLHVVSRMLRLLRIFERDRERVLESVGLEAWSFDTLAVIRRDEAGVVTAGELAAAVVVTLGTMTTRLKSLERRGWVVRQPAAHDRRVVEVSLTDDGERRFDAVFADVLECQRAIVEPLAEADADELMRLLRIMVAHVE
jgi:DNA-binding MarR family transcriptional regulator